MAAYYLAVDIGASSGRHILGHMENGKMVLEEIYRFENGMVKKDGELCWEFDRLFKEVVNGLKKCKEIGKIPVSMGVDTWGVDFVLLDKNDNVLGNTVGYRDHRTEGMDKEVYKAISLKDLYARTGIQKADYNTIYQLMAVKKKHPEYLEQAETLLHVPDYFHFLLTGQKTCEYTEATTGQLVSPITKDWDYELIDMLGYPRKMFQKLIMPGTGIGHLSDKIREEVGFDLEVVAPATHDTGSAVLAVPANDDDFIYISSGTWSLMGIERKEADCSEKSCEMNFTNEGGYAGRFRYLKNIMGLWMIQSVKKEFTEDLSFAEICERASKETITSLVDCNDDCFLAPKSMIEAVKKFCRDSKQQVPETVGEIAAVIYNSLAKCYGDTIEEIEALTGKKYTTIYVVGGGANAGYLNELTAKYTGKKVSAGPSEATAIGNIVVQMLHDGVFKDLPEARTCVGKSFDVKIYEKMEEEKMTRYESAKEIYAKLGVDTDAAIAKCKEIPVSLHCWQGDDVTGFDHDGPLTGGIQTTGNYPGKARTPEELLADMDKAMSLMPGKKKINVHACYAIFEDGEFVDRDKLEPKHFQKWVDFAKERGMGLDFNPTFFSHPMVKDGLTLSSPDEEVRNFWIEHGKACIRISQYFAEQTGVPCVMNIWTGDGFKDIPADRMGPRVRYKESIDAILSEPFDTNLVKPCVESKVFGIGVEAYTVGSAEFSLSYAAMNKDKCLPLMDNGHYHPTEVVSDKIPALLTFFPEIALHVTRPIRWDSDHVVLFDDETKEIAKEIVRCENGIDRTYIALDYFDASINRISAWVTGFRSFQKALLDALCQPSEMLKELQDTNQMSKKMVVMEQCKTLPIGDVWEEYCRQCGVEAEGWFDDIQKYEDEVLSKRA